MKRIWEKPVCHSNDNYIVIYPKPLIGNKKLYLCYCKNNNEPDKNENLYINRYLINTYVKHIKLFIVDVKNSFK